MRIVDIYTSWYDKKTLLDVYYIYYYKVSVNTYALVHPSRSTPISKKPLSLGLYLRSLRQVYKRSLHRSILQTASQPKTGHV